jgi:hypothetical protein
MAINFPASPTTNQIFTSGSLKFIFNGTSWDAVATDAPSDTNAYGRKAGAWVDVTEESPADSKLYARYNGTWSAVPAGVAGVDKQVQFNDGGVVGAHSGLTYDKATGKLVVGADPSAALGVATKQYVDARPALVFISDTAPISPLSGHMWWNSTNGNLFIYYNDGDSSQWIQVNNSVSV